MAERVSQTVLQVVATSTSNERVAQSVLQIVATSTSNERVTQTVLQVAANTSGNERVSQSVLQIVAPPSYQNSVIAASHNNPGVTASSITFTKPTGTTNKNLIIAVVSFAGDPGAINITPPSGFTQILYIPTTTTPGSMGIYYKYAKGGEPSTYTFSWTGGNQIASGGMLTINGPTLNNPIGTTADDVSVIHTNAPVTATLNPISNYSMIIDILGWTGAQSFTSPNGPWSTQFVDSNTAGMSTALSARNWDTGITVAQTAALSGSPSSYIAASIEIQGSVTPPPPGKKKLPIEGYIRIITGGRIIGNQVYFNHKSPTILYNKLKRIGFPRKPIILKTLTSTPVVLHTNISVFREKLITLTASTINLVATLKKSIGKTLSVITIISNTINKQVDKTLKSSINISVNLVKTRFVNLVSNIVTTMAALNHGPSQLLIANVNLNASTILLKSLSLNLIVSSITLTSTLLKNISKILQTVIILSSIQIKRIIISIIANVIGLSATLVHGPSILLEAIVNVGLGSILLKTINPILSTSVTLISTVSQFLNVVLIASISLLASIIKNATNTLTTMVNNIATLFNTIGINLISNLISLTSLLSKTDTAITIFLSTSIAISTSLIKQVNQLLISNLIIFINTLIHSTAVILITNIITNSNILKTVGKIFKGLIRIASFLPGRQAPPLYNLYMPLHNNTTVILNMPLSTTKLLYLSLNPQTKSDIIVNI